jgi:hypothetical protein
LTKLLGANINASAELQNFFVHDLSTAMLRTTQQTHFSTTDHGCCVLLDDICESQVTIFRVFSLLLSTRVFCTQFVMRLFSSSGNWTSIFESHWAITGQYVAIAQRRRRTVLRVSRSS